MQYKFKLSRIHCAGCALALEQNINEIEGVSAEINFVTKSLKLQIDTKNPAETLTEVKITISKFDHSIELIDYEDEEDQEKKEKHERIINISRYSFSALILILNIFVSVTWLKISLYVVAYFASAYDVLWKACLNIIHGKLFDEEFLMAVASIGAFAIGEYIEAVCVMVLFGVGEIFEDIAVDKSKKTIKRVLEIKQPYANLIEGDSDTQVSLETIKIGDIIRIKPGERVPLDSVIIEGTSYLDMAALTGETKDRVVTVGDEVLSGSINCSSVLLVKVKKLEKDSTVSKIIDMVQNATETKARPEKFISKFSKVYTPTVILLALLLAFIPPIFSGYSNFVSYLYRALCFLVVSCPCALVISVPLSYFAGIGASAKAGIMIKGANYLEALAKVDAVIFDKTGTLTEGVFEVTEIYATKKHTKNEILEIAAYAENFSNHKIAKSILNVYNEVFKGKEINNAWVNDYTEMPGKGIKASIFMQETLVGNAKLLKENDIDFVEVSKPGTVLYVASAGNFLGYLVVNDVIKKDSKTAILKLYQMGLKDVSMSTGDEKNVAEAVSNEIGLKNYYAGLLPEDKVAIINEKINANHNVAFVGDGINDAPSLASASVGLAMGGFGSDIAVEAADVVIMTDEPSKVATAIKKARKTKKLVVENIVGSIFVKVAVLALVAFGFSGMWLAVFADVGVSLLAVLNSLRTMLK